MKVLGRDLKEDNEVKSFAAPSKCQSSIIRKGLLGASPWAPAGSGRGHPGSWARLVLLTGSRELTGSPQGAGCSQGARSTQGTHRVLGAHRELTGARRVPAAHEEPGALSSGQGAPASGAEQGQNLCVALSSPSPHIHLTEVLEYP